ncbi:ubiquitin family protein isoform X2 [Carex rostrata]
MASEGDEVVVTVRFVGPYRPASLPLPPVMKVGELRRRIALSRDLPSDRLKLVLCGKTLHDKQSVDSVEDATVRLSHGDCLMVAVMPTRPAKHLHDDHSDDEDEELVEICSSSNSRSVEKESFHISQPQIENSRYSADGNVLYGPEGMGIHHSLVFISAYCSEIGSWAYLYNRYWLSSDTFESWEETTG